MLVKLTAQQQRVIGVLLEKEVTTPEQYPLSLNGLALGCNQKSSREPVMNLTESDVQNTLDELRDKKLIFEQNTGSRVVKYKHRFCNTEFSDLQFTPQQKAIICLLLLRGPQTPGELRARSSRLADFTNVEEVELALEQMKDLGGEQLVVQLPKEPGKRDCRYVHQFGNAQQAQASSNDIASALPARQEAPQTAHDDKQRIEILEQQVHSLNEQVAELREMIEILSE